MVETGDTPLPDGKALDSVARPRWRKKAGLGVAGLAVLTLAGLWMERVALVRSLIDDELARLSLPARYRIDSVGPGGVVLSDVVVGDPRHPDLTVARVEAAIGLGALPWLTPGLARLTLESPHLQGRWRDGQLDLGSLNPLLQSSPGAAPFRLPDWSLVLRDGRASIDAGKGRVVVTAAGRGRLSGGFSGSLALATSDWRDSSCHLGPSTMAARIATRAGRARLEGPLLVAAGRCGALAWGPLRFDLLAQADGDFAGGTLGGALTGGQLSAPGVVAGGSHAGVDVAWHKGDSGGSVLGGRLSGGLDRVEGQDWRLQSLRLDGLVHARDSFAALDWRGTLDGDGLRHSVAIERALRDNEAAMRGTLVAPLLARLHQALERDEPRSHIHGDITLRRNPGQWSVVAPVLTVTGSGGRQMPLATITRAMVAGGGPAGPTLSGAFALAGRDWPALHGGVSSSAGGATRIALAMDDYRAGDAVVAVPALTVVAGRGTLDLHGALRLSGALPGGHVDDLTVPLDGGLGKSGPVFGRQCLRPRWTRLQLASLTLGPAAIDLCPGPGGLLRRGREGWQLAGTIRQVALSGTMAQDGAGPAPFRLDGGPVTLAWPGTSAAHNLRIARGSGETGDRVTLDLVEAVAGHGDPTGRFSGASARLAALPAEIAAASGVWGWRGGALAIDRAALRLSDRTRPARFAPVEVRDGQLEWRDGVITGEGQAFASDGKSALAHVTLRHDLASGRGHADVAVAGLTFAQAAKADEGAAKSGLQPADLTDFAKGVIANVDGTVTGSASLDWQGQSLTGTGTFTTKDLDFAAAFGPVKGLSGTLVFTDLPGLVTAPHQVFHVASVNPGIEVDDGTIDLQVLPQQVIRLNSAVWPFVGGRLLLEPTDLAMAVAEPRRFTVVIEGLDAARFLQHMDMSNIAATGIFDGRLPLVFDASGGRITGGALQSRGGGGSVSYVGALTYKDLSPIANYAFSALRAMDYRTMTIGMEGDLGGEVVTRVSFSGVRQGKGASRNFITRQLADLPIRFDINVRAQFYQLIMSMRSLYDASLLRDPRGLGLVDASGHALHPAPAQPVPAPAGSAAPIQSPASGNLP